MPERLYIKNLFINITSHTFSILLTILVLCLYLGYEKDPDEKLRTFMILYILITFLILVIEVIFYQRLRELFDINKYKVLIYIIIVYYVNTMFIITTAFVYFKFYYIKYGYFYLVIVYSNIIECGYLSLQQY